MKPKAEWHRSPLLSLVLCLFAIPVSAGPRLVRVIWDVGRGAVYTKAEDRAEPGHDTFAVPATAAIAEKTGFARYEGYEVMRKGDRVRLYVVNYNSVSHLWHESSVVEQFRRDPSLVAVLLNSGLLAVTGVIKLPGAGIAPLGPGAAALSSTGRDDPCNDLVAALNAFRGAANTLYNRATTLQQQAATLGLTTDAGKIVRVPTRPSMWTEFDNTSAWRVLTTDATVAGFDFEAKYASFPGAIRDVNAGVRDVNRTLLVLDHAIVNPAGCSTATTKAIIDHRDNLVSFVKDTAASESPLRDTINAFTTANNQWSEFKRKLNNSNWASDAQEVIVKEPVAEDAVLRLDAVFVSPDKTFTERTQRSLVLRVASHFPALTIASGVAFNRFQFKKLQIEQAATAAADGSPLAKGRVVTVDDASWQQIVPIWTQNIRLKAGRQAGLYGTFGTTPDRNIFRNAIVGASVLVPRWRTTFTVGMITARGHEQDDLTPVVAQFSDSSGFAVKDTAVASLPLPKTGWKRSPFLAIGFTLVSF